MKRNGFILPVDYHLKGCERINASHGVVKPLYMSKQSIKNARNELTGFPAFEYSSHCKYRHFLNYHVFFQIGLIFKGKF